MIDQRRPRNQYTSLTLVVPTYNEERNLEDCLGSTSGWVSRIFIIDSGSGDRTVEIGESHGGAVVSHPFETHARQWEWALTNLPIETEWVLGLDADQRITPELAAEIQEFLSRPKGSIAHVSGCYIKRRQIFRGKWIRHGGYYPKYLLKLFRLSRVELDHNDLVDHHFRVSGETINLKHDIVEDNRNEADISAWIEKHNRYSSLQAQEEFGIARAPSRTAHRGRLGGTPDEKTQRAKSIWRKMPLYVRPFLYFNYRYFLRLGFLDGKQGFIFHFLQAFWYRLLVDIKLDELRRGSGTEIALSPAVGSVTDGLHSGKVPGA